MDDSSITLPDGRRLGFRSLGDRDGFPLLFFHGTPGTRFALSADDAIARIPGVRLVLPERPGYGISDPQPDRTLLDYSDDIEQLVDHLGIDSFAVAGGSGGGPHALACAYKLGHRVTTALLFSSPSPAGFEGATEGLAFGNRLGLWLGRYAPRVLRWMMNGYASALARNPDKLVDAMLKQMAPADRAILEEPECRETMIRDLREAYRQGAGGHYTDSTLAMTSRDWGFGLDGIEVPVHLWHGEHDTLVSPNMARQLAAEIPDCTVSYVPGAGHLLTETPEVAEAVTRILRSSTPSRIRSKRPVIIRRLTPADAAGYRALMLEAYEAHPDAFTSTASERAALPLRWWEDRLTDRNAGKDAVWGAFEGDQLVGVAGLSRESRKKVSHKATLYGMYVQPPFRGRGIADRLVESVMRYASSSSGLGVVQLTVTEANRSARSLYERHGFVAFGIEPYAVRVAEGFVAKVHMWCRVETARAVASPPHTEEFGVPTCCS